MAEYNKILQDPHNPILVTSREVIFPEWLSKEPISLSDLHLTHNKTRFDWIIEKHASYYDADKWYPMISEYTPKSIFMDISNIDAEDIIEHWKFNRQLEVEKILTEYHFVRSSARSSHTGRKVTTFNEFMDEITHPNVIMSFKRGCRKIMFREYIDDILAEYRIYVWNGSIRYIEEYTRKQIISTDPIILKQSITNYALEVGKRISYLDYIIDIGYSQNNGFFVIEMNTPFYLLGGLHLGNYHYESDRIHYTSKIIFRYRDSNGEVEEC